ncbi:MAG: hypothetical protein OEZ16_08835 [Chromatiales bacterium]|nr:hypothetical protein [Chromatiales bacterium]
MVVKRVNRACRSWLVGTLTLGLPLAGDVHADESLWRALSEGGKVVLMRHSSLQKGSGSGDSLIRDPSCMQEKNLSGSGRDEAKSVGERFREKSIKVEKVLHSPYCRTSDTSKLSFGVTNPAEVLSLLQVLTPEQQKSRTEELDILIGSYTGEGNMVLVTHEPNIRAVSFEILNYSDLLILNPEGNDAFEELGVIRWKK